MFHVNDNGDVKPCKAQTPQNCDFYKGEDDSRHYESVAEAVKGTEARLKAEHGEIKKNVRYSFVKEFKEQEEKFKHDFDGFPTRFFKADLRGKLVSNMMDLDRFDDVEDEDIDSDLLRGVWVNPSDLSARLASFSSSPQDLKMTDEEAVALAEEMGLTNIRKIENPSTLKALDTDRAWVAESGGQTIALTGSAVNSKNFGSYRFRYKQPDFDGSNGFVYMDLRILNGVKRVFNKTGTNLIAENDSKTTAERNVQKVHVLQTLNKMEDAQREGSNFIAQKKYVKDHSGTVATAWMDKKNPDAVRQDMMKNTVLNKYFKKVEIDNDVDPAEFADFEQAYIDAMDKLPKIPAGKEPELKVRKLGKHRASGMYFPHKNVVAIDVKTSGSFVHEMAHQHDMAVMGNASLQKEFAPIVKRYTELLEIPAGEPASRADYLSTPTEVYARFYEQYAEKVLKIDSRLVDSSKFDRYDHEPIKDDELREKAFKFFDKMYENQNQTS